MTRAFAPLPLLASAILSLLLVQATHAYLFINYQQQQQQQAAASANLGLLPNGFNLAPPIGSNNLNLAGQQQQQQQSSQQLQDRQHYQAANQLFQQDSSNNNNNNQDSAQYLPQSPSQATSNTNQQQQPAGISNSNTNANSNGPATYSGNLNNGQQLQLQQQQLQQLQQAASYQQPSGSSRNAQQAPSGISDREVSPIFRFHGTALNSSTVKLVWSLMSGYQADLFEIKYGPIPDTEVFSVTLNGSARDYTVSSLQADVPYQFRLQAYQADGRSWKPQLYMMEPLKGHTLQSASSSSIRQQMQGGGGGFVELRELTPLGVKAEAKSNQTIQLSWSEQERPKELASYKRINFIRYYVVSGQSAGAPSANNETTTASPTSSGGSTPSPPVASNSSTKYHYLNVSESQIRESRVIIHKLKPATEYAFAVRTAYYAPPDSGRPPVLSGFSMDTLVKTFDLEPSAPLNFSLQPMQLTRDEIQQGQTIPKLELTWGPPESPNGQLKGYVILYAHEPNPPNDKWSRIQVNDSSINNWYVANLRPGASYYFKMRAVNQRGQSQDTETRLFIAPPLASPAGPGGAVSPHHTIGRMDAPIPANNILMLIVICLIAILFILFLVVSRLFCRTRAGSGQRKSSGQRKAAAGRNAADQHQQSMGSGGADASAKLNGFGSSTVTGRMGTLARRTQRQVNESQGGAGGKPDFWISAMDQQHQQATVASSDIKSNLSEKSNTSDNINMAAMVSIQRDSPQQFTTQTTQLAPMLPEYRLAAEQQLLQQIQHQGHYHPGHQQHPHHQHQFSGALGYDQMDNATASALMTLSKRQQQQLQKYQIQFASTGAGSGGTLMQAPSPHQQPPPPPPLNIEQQQQQQQQQQQTLYGTHQALNSTRSLRLHRPTLYDPVSGSFVQPTTQQDPPNYNSHLNSMLNGVHHQLQSFNNNSNNNTSTVTTSGSNTLQFHHPHQTSTLMSRRSTNTLRSFQSSTGPGLYGQLGANSFAVPPSLPSSIVGNNGVTQSANEGGNQPHLLQSHQAVINQLNDSSTYPSLPLKHVSAVRPQMMSSLDDQIEMELAEKQAEQQHQQNQQQQQQQQQQQLQQHQNQQQQQD